MRFANPEFLLLLIPWVLVFLYLWRKGARKRARMDVPLEDWMKEKPLSSRVTPFRVHFLLRSLATLLMIVALARPQEVLTRERRTVESVDMLISFDLSRSMEAQDFEPSRRVVAISLVNDFIDQRKDDRIGLVLFSGEAYLSVPLTIDHEMVKKAIAASSNRLLQDGTAIGQSLAVGVHHLRFSEAKSRVIILVTDGDNNMGSVDPETAAELARAYGIKIYTIAIGKKGRVRYPEVQTDPLTGRSITQYLWLEDAINEELLERIAKRTGAESFRATDAAILESIFDRINELEKTKIETQKLTRFRESAWPILLIAFLLLIFEGLLLNSRWRKYP